MQEKKNTTVFVSESSLRRVHVFLHQVAKNLETICAVQNPIYFSNLSTSRTFTHGAYNLSIRHRIYLLSAKLLSPSLSSNENLSNQLASFQRGINKCQNMNKKGFNEVCR